MLFFLHSSQLLPVLSHNFFHLRCCWSRVEGRHSPIPAMLQEASTFRAELLWNPCTTKGSLHPWQQGSLPVIPLSPHLAIHCSSKVVRGWRSLNIMATSLVLQPHSFYHWKILPNRAIGPTSWKHHLLGNSSPIWQPCAVRGHCCDSAPFWVPTKLCFLGSMASNCTADMKAAGQQWTISMKENTSLTCECW